MNKQHPSRPDIILTPLPRFSVSPAQKMHPFSYNVKIPERSPGPQYTAKCIRRVSLKRLPRNVLVRLSSINVESSAPILQLSQPAVTRPLPSVHNSDWQPLQRQSQKRRKRRQRRPRFVFVILFTLDLSDLYCITARTRNHALRPQGIEAANERWQGRKMIVTTLLSIATGPLILSYSRIFVVFLTTFNQSHSTPRIRHDRPIMV